jgi:two-component sensor histidine kinase
VRFSWVVDEAARRLTLVWAESDGPAVTAPQARGFGSQLIDRGLSPRGQVLRSYDASGFRAEFVAPLDELQAG